MKIVYAEHARRDIADIYEHVAASDPIAAQKVEDAIRSLCKRLADFPYASAKTSEPHVRRVPLVRYPYAIFFRIDTERGLVEIARVIHGARVQALDEVPENE